jgi:hypothetical protein
MSIASAEPTTHERELAAALRSAVEAEIAERSLGRRELAALFDVMPVAVDALFARPSWPLDVSVRVAGSLGLNVTMEVARES